MVTEDVALQPGTIEEVVFEAEDLEEARQDCRGDRDLQHPDSSMPVWKTLSLIATFSIDNQHCPLSQLTFLARSSKMMASLTDHNSPYTQPVCQNCQTSTTPLWRRDEGGSVLCNACGLFLKLHGRPRPISLKTDVIKSRNRVKSSAQGPKKKYESLPASQSVDTPNGTHRRVSQMAASIASDRSGSPVSRTMSPSGQHDPNIAPQHIFDGVTLTDHAFQSPSLPSLHLNQPSPGSASSDRHLEPPMTYEQLLVANTHLKTRVSELEVINMMYSDNENTLRNERDNAVRTQESLKRRVQELEDQLRSGEDQEHPQKKPRLSDSTT